MKWAGQHASSGFHVLAELVRFSTANNIDVEGMGASQPHSDCSGARAQCVQDIAIICMDACKGLGTICWIKPAAESSSKQYFISHTILSTEQLGMNYGMDMVRDCTCLPWRLPGLSPGSLGTASCWFSYPGDSTSACRCHTRQALWLWTAWFAAHLHGQAVRSCYRFWPYALPLGA